MPGRSLEPTADVIPTIKIGSLKGHKNLPRRSHVAVDPRENRSSDQRRRLSRTSDQINYDSTERITSWIPEPSRIHPIPGVDRPLTPPISFRDGFQSWIDDAALRKREFSKTEEKQNFATTPLVQQSPPTPDASPPKKISRAQAVASFSSSQDFIESRSDSFKTAQENQSSDDEGHSADSPSLYPSRQKWLRTVGAVKQRDVGLGLGLELEDEEPTPRVATPKQSPDSKHFGTFDGSWVEEMEKHTTSEVLEDPLKPTTRRAMLRRPRLASEPVLDSPTLGTTPDPSIKKSFSLRDKSERSHRSPLDTSLEKFAQRIGWPLKDRDPDIRERDSKRLSEASTTSTVVEAVVIKSTPQRRQTLRRTSKMLDLNTPSQHSHHSSSVSNDLSIRRRLRRSISPDQELRRSFVSMSPEGDGLDIGKTRQEDHAPVIPVRRSSLRSSASGSRGLSGTFSLTSRQQSSRPTTAPEESVGYFDIPRPRDRRTMSVVVHAPTPLKPEHRVLQESEPTRLEASPPSMPASTTEELSKSTSTASANPDAFVPPATPNGQPSATLHLSDVQNAQSSSLDHPNGAEWSAMRPRSTLVTPFSLRSAHSSTPGTLEVNEATAISIYPHTNRSILVIQQMAGRSDTSPKERSAIIAGNANIALNGLPGGVTSVIQHQAPPELSREASNSPLQNPRDPPQPPDFKIIPPTPANASGSLDNRRLSPRTGNKANRLSTPVSTLKRALSARRPRSESFVAPFTRSFSLRGTAGNPVRHIQQDEPQTKLHPFWRPRNHNDESDSDSEFGNTGFLHGSRVQSHSSSRDGPPRRSMSLTRRLTNSMRVPHHVRRLRPSSLVLPSDRKRYNVRHPTGDEKECIRPQVNLVPSQSYEVQSSGFRGLVDRLERRREAKEEGKREERREWLRGKIKTVRRASAGPGLVQRGSN